MSDALEAEPPKSKKGVRKRRRRRSRNPREPEPRRASRPVLFGLSVALGLAVAAIATYLLVLFPASHGPGAGRAREVTIERDEPVDAVVAKLDAAGLVRSRGLFGVYARMVGMRAAPGRHLLTDDASPQELVRRLERMGQASRVKITIPEGWNRFDVARRLEDKQVALASAFLDATTDATLLREIGVAGESAEGFLFPATYELARDADPREVVRRLTGEFQRRFMVLEQNHRLGLAQLEGSLGWGRREIVTLASLVEKEAAVDDERPIIASVFLNRLRDPSFHPHVLQCDPSAGYGCLAMRDRIPSCAGYAGKITHAINVDPLNPYSTYVHEGLPPGPIANPGLKSLQAVLAPASTKYLYFVARGEGRRHSFSETLDEHNAAVRDFRERTGHGR